jgi:hypothetical protein
MRQNRRTATSGISGVIVIIGIILALKWGGGFNFPIFFVALAISSLVGPLSSGNPRAAYGGFIGFCWMLMLALFFLTGSWIWFLVGAAISAVMGSLFKPAVEGLSNTVFFGSTNRYRPQQQPYQPQQEPYRPQEMPYEQGYQARQNEEVYLEGNKQYYYPSGSTLPRSQSQEYPPSSPEVPEAQYPQQLPPQ